VGAGSVADALESSTGIMTDGDAIADVDCVPTGAATSTECDCRAESNSPVWKSGDSPDEGMTNLDPHFGQTPRFPAKCVFTFSLWPLGQEKRIPMCSDPVDNSATLGRTWRGKASDV